MSTIIPLHIFGGQGTLIHFAHGNGYPPACYSPLMNSIIAQTRVIGMKSRPLWDESEIEKLSGWSTLVNDLMEFLHRRNLHQIIGMGHSVGAMITALSAVQEPERYRALIFIEPTLFLPTQHSMVRMMPQGLLKSQPLFSQVLSRPAGWETAEDAAEYVNNGAGFATWTDEAKQRYIEHGFRQSNEGVKFTFGPEWELQIYRQVPRLWRTLRAINMPTLAIRGASSQVINDKVWERWQKTQPDATFVEIAGADHWLPMEKPVEVGEQILRFLADNNLLDG